MSYTIICTLKISYFFLVPYNDQNKPKSIVNKQHLTWYKPKVNHFH